MKKSILFLTLCFLSLAIFAQQKSKTSKLPELSRYATWDSTIRYNDGVNTILPDRKKDSLALLDAMQNAPYILRLGKELRNAQRRFKDTEGKGYVAGKYIVNFVFRGTISVGDTIEIVLREEECYDGTGDTYCPSLFNVPINMLETKETVVFLKTYGKNQMKQKQMEYYEIQPLSRFIYITLTRGNAGKNL
jgi:hypothetical protein